MDATVTDHAERIEAAMLGALAGEAAAGTAAGAADLLGVAESLAAAGGLDEADLRGRGLERPSRSGDAGLLLRAVALALMAPLNRPALRRDAYRCVALAGPDEGTEMTAVATALLTADLMRFDTQTALLRVHQSLLEDASMALLDRLRPAADAPSSGESAEAVDALQSAITALCAADDVAAVIEAARAGPPAGIALAGALAGARQGPAALQQLDAEALAHGERAVQIAHRITERLHDSPPAGAESAG